ncbi:MAG: ADP-L-glycero-D-manno-heptose-6-epimerase [Chlamydiales bacterium]|nr:ADP-L-glycero-D-manno-heptose-6-epimerase [Chlamydiales bacterium]MCH9635895.1 ADP-L-glycero-D-manno-heptose-6-epimerase [Chlamydiales bacterium]MCH9703876.1 NAD(P)-dependent oxidoreductase [Chlamydiota bacterium]
MDKEVVLVTGSAGRVGAAVIKKLGNERRIVGFELMNALYASANEELVPCDLSSDESVAQALAHIRNFYGNKIASVIHLAAYYSFTNTSMDLYNKITVEGTRRLLRGLQDFEVEQFIFSSTMLVHEPCAVGEKITEESPVNPKWAYPLSKVLTEKVIEEERGNIPTVVLRISGVYDDDCHSIPISNQIQRIYENQVNAHLFAGDMSHGADFMHNDDLANCLIQCVHKRKELPKQTTLLVGEGQTLSYAQLQDQISHELFGHGIKTLPLPKPLCKFGAWFESLLPFSSNNFILPWMIDLADDHYDLDISKAKKLLDWEPKHHLEQTLPLMIADLQKDPEAWYKKNGLKMSKQKGRIHA